MKSNYVFDREGVEWTHLWWEKAGEAHGTRIAVVGDSITFNYRTELQQLLSDRDIRVDMLAGSRCAGDPALDAELEYFFGPECGYKYDIIHFNNGLHGECNNTKITLEVYESGMKRCVDIIRRLQPQAKLILVTSTHISKEGDIGILDLERNKVVMQRNEIVRKLASENGLFLDDLFPLVAGNADCPQNDGIHFGPEGVAFLANTVAQCCLSVMGISDIPEYKLPFEREKVEWARFWWANASDIEKSRIAIVGDYTSLGFYHNVQDSVWSQNVCVCASLGSRCAGDPALEGELEYFFGSACGYNYDIIHLNNLANGITVDGEGSTVPINAYENGMRRILEIIRRLQPHARLVVTALEDPRSDAEQAMHSPDVLAVMRERGETVRKLSSEFGFEVHDILPIKAGISEPPYGFRYFSDLDAMKRTSDAVSDLARTLITEEKSEEPTVASTDDLIPNKAY